MTSGIGLISYCDHDVVSASLQHVAAARGTNLQRGRRQLNLRHEHRMMLKNSRRLNMIGYWHEQVSIYIYSIFVCFFAPASFVTPRSKMASKLLPAWALSVSLDAQMEIFTSIG